MSPIFSVFDLVILACIAQGLITSILLLKSKHANVSNILLGLALILLCIVSFRIIFHNVGLSNFPHIRYIPLGWELFVPPFFYLYIRSLTEAGFKWQNSSLVHFILPGVYLVYNLFIYFISFQIETINEQSQLVATFYYHQVNEIEDYLIILSSIAYAFLGLKVILRFRTKTNKLKLKQVEMIFKWLKTIFIAMGLAALFLTINEIIDLTIEKPIQGFNHWKIFSLYLAASIYYIGIKGYKLDTSSIHNNKQYIESVSSKLDNETMALAEKRLTEQLEGKAVYLNPEITLDQLADLIDTSPENLSFIINHKFSKNFRDLINSYRIDAVKSKLQESDNLTILDIALDCGFNSQASFYRSFKKFEGMTPKAYLDSKK